MLVLSRKKHQQIVVPQHDIVVTVLDVHRDRVRIGISAPAGVAVHRQEVWARVGQRRTLELPRPTELTAINHGNPPP